ncbi:hypothetical protein [Pendulispora albinea]|uniref:Energy transducer TonB n=1 Tax=Pendulispora albinea TaxID=2741071 RepID=A0ABZ2LR98_9BACT
MNPQRTLILLLALITLACSSSPTPVRPRDYGESYNARGLTRPIRISGTDPTFSREDGSPCIAPGSSGIVSFHCTLDVDGNVSGCIPITPPIVGCEQATVEAVKVLENHHYHPVLMNGRPVKTGYTFTFHIVGDGVRAAPVHPLPAPSEETKTSPRESR